MRLEVTKLGMKIVPENETDEVYIERFLGLKENGDWLPLVRQNAIGLSCLGSLSTHPFPGTPKKHIKQKYSGEDEPA
jgi:hypothetical protein